MGLVVSIISLAVLLILQIVAFAYWMGGLSHRLTTMEARRIEDRDAQAKQAEKDKRDLEEDIRAVKHSREDRVDRLDIRMDRLETSLNEKMDECMEDTRKCIHDFAAKIEGLVSGMTKSMVDFASRLQRVEIVKLSRDNMPAVRPGSGGGE